MDPPQYLQMTVQATARVTSTYPLKEVLSCQVLLDGIREYPSLKVYLQLDF